MSLDATLWAWKAPVNTATQRLVLLSLADRAGEYHTCFPSISRLVVDTKLNRKTIMSVLDKLEEMNLVQDTGERKGNGVKVYRLIGVIGREDDLTSTKIGTSGKNGTSTKIGTATSTKNGTATSTKNGTQNLSRNLSIESKNKNNWLSLKTLKKELELATDPETIEHIKTAKWFERELSAFENFNADKKHNPAVMHYLFADWLLRNMSKYQAQTEKPQAGKSSSKATGLSEKQIQTFAKKLSLLPEIATKYAQGTETYDQLAIRLAQKLQNPSEAKKLEPYLRQVGFSGVLNEVAARSI